MPQVHSANALAGSCKMSADGDPMGCVDEKLLVRGVPFPDT
jgi:hypothetical protein